MVKDNMYTNFEMLKDRVFDALNKTDLVELKQKLEEIKDPTLVAGVGGSSVVSNFMKKVLEEKNNIICEEVDYRDLGSKNIKNFKNIIACSYTGYNYGVDYAFQTDLNHYLFSSNGRVDANNITYNTSLKKESSFISLAATLVPMSILLAYYLNLDYSVIEKILNTDFDIELIKSQSNIYEIITGYETSTAARYLESTLVEAGLGVPVLHEKYSICHGRTTLGKALDYKSNVILLSNWSELDDKIFESLKEYKECYLFDKQYIDNIVNDYCHTYMGMLLTKKIAEHQNKDLSIVDYSPAVKKLYYFRGGMYGGYNLRNW